MPVVAVYGGPDWYVPDTDVSDELLTSKQRLTCSIMNWLPEVVAASIYNVSQTDAVDTSSVFVRPERLSGRSINAPDWWILVSPIARATLVSAQEDLRKLIKRGVSRFLLRRLSCTDVCNPSFDVDISFIKGCGCSVDSVGKVVAEW